jgi:hypothetical protein
MTLLYLVLSTLPIVQVESRVCFGAKITTLIVTANLVGAALFIGKRPRQL